MAVKREGLLVLIALTTCNLYNYFCRYIPSVMKDLLKEDLRLSDFQTGVIFTAFIVCYMVVSPLIGMLADRRIVKRKYILFAGMLLWSVATSACALCHSFWALLIPRILFGIGEAMFTTLGPPLLSDFFGSAQRNVVMAVFLGATPIGCALGYAVAGALGQRLGWRTTFAVLGIPGILAFALLLIREPELGASDAEDGETTALRRQTEQSPDTASTVAAVPAPAAETATQTEGAAVLGAVSSPTSNGSVNSGATLHQIPIAQKKGTLLQGNFIVPVAGYVAVTFGMGGFADWLPAYFVRYHGMTLEHAGLVNGAIVVVGGLLGTVLGGILADWTARHVTSRHPYLLLSGVTMTLSAVFGGLALFAWQETLIVVQALFLFAIFFGWCYNGPINALIQNSVPAQLRARANGVSVLLIHLFGDAISPSIIGATSDATRSDLRGALTIVPAAIAVAGFIWLGGWLTLPRAARSGGVAPPLGMRHHKGGYTLLPGTSQPRPTESGNGISDPDLSSLSSSPALPSDPSTSPPEPLPVSLHRTPKLAAPSS